MKIYNKIIVAIFLLVVSGCDEDFLDLTDPNAITTGSFWSSPADVESAIVTLYPTFNSLWDGAPESSNLRSDAVALAAVDFAQFNQFYTFVNTPVNGVSDGFWFDAYTLIFRVNTILQEMENIEFTDAAQKDLLTAEALFFRGAAYFRLAHLYGQVPIVLQPAETEDEFNNPKAESIGAVWDQAIADLQTAKNGLPLDQDLEGAVTKGAAMGFLGKLYLYRAGYLGDNSYYALAASEFKEIIDLGKYGLVADWMDNFLSGNENNEESLYEAQYDVFSGSYDATQPRPGNASVPGISGEIVSKPSEWIFDEMTKEMTIDNEMDVRLLNTLYFEGGLSLFGVAFADLGDGLVCGSGDGGGGNSELDCWEEDLTGEDGFWTTAIEELVPGAEIVEVILFGCWDPVAETEFENIGVRVDQGCRIIFNNWTEEVIGNGCEASNDGGSFPGWFRKYLPVDLACYLDGPAVNNERILRFADILLMYAEALVMSGGSLTDAADAVNQVRQRVNLPVMTFANGTELMTEIEHQRVMEFVMEGTRYFDLIRWGTLVETLNAHGFPDGASNIDFEKHKYFPIPLGEVNSNELLDQNPLWN
ncbi:MAG: RagB/SusD family nutrient uptake outer membrane protein [Cyclobacteriaceae bacterium]